MSKLRSILVIALLLVLGLGGLGWVIWRQVVPDVEADHSAERQDAQETIAGAKSALALAKPDAKGFTFGKVFVHWQGDDPAVCGMVDIDEAPDPLIGMERFIYLQDNLLLDEDDGTAALDQQWGDICKDDD